MSKFEDEHCGVSEEDVIDALNDEIEELFEKVRLAEEISHKLLIATKSEAMVSILVERLRQDRKWGEQNHDPFCYLTILGEEYGEVCQAALHLRFGGQNAKSLREEAVHTAAVAVALVECLDRGKWKWPGGGA